MGSAGIVEKRGDSFAGKVRGSWILFTWGRSLFPVPLKRVVFLGQHVTLTFGVVEEGRKSLLDVHESWRAQIILEMDKKGQCKSRGLCCSDYPKLSHVWLWSPSSEV